MTWICRPWQVRSRTAAHAGSDCCHRLYPGSKACLGSCGGLQAADNGCCGRRAKLHSRRKACFRLGAACSPDRQPCCSLCSGTDCRNSRCVQLANGYIPLVALLRTRCKPLHRRKQRLLDILQTAAQAQTTPARRGANRTQAQTTLVCSLQTAAPTISSDNCR